MALWMKHVSRGGEPCFTDTAASFWSTAALQTFQTAPSRIWICAWASSGPWPAPVSLGQKGYQIPTSGSLHGRIEENFHPCEEIEGMDPPALLPLSLPAWIHRKYCQKASMSQNRKSRKSLPARDKYNRLLCHLSSRATDLRAYKNLITILLLGTLGLKDVHPV
jgi:hypothetical protein